MACVAALAALKVTFIKFKVSLRALATKLRILGVELLESRSEGFLVPASDNQHSIDPRAIEHLSQAL